jgi:hypothetical protein
MTITRCVSPLADPAVRAILQSQALHDLYAPAPAQVTIPEGGTDAFRDLVLDVIGDQRMTYLEFGVAGGYSMRAMTSRFTHPDSRFLGEFKQTAQKSHRFLDGRRGFGCGLPCAGSVTSTASMCRARASAIGRRRRSDPGPGRRQEWSALANWLSSVTRCPSWTLLAGRPSTSCFCRGTARGK